MASLKVMLDKQKINQEGECPVMIKVLHNRGRRLINLFQKVKIDDWDIKKARLNEKHGTLEQRQKHIMMFFLYATATHRTSRPRSAIFCCKMIQFFQHKVIAING